MNSLKVLFCVLLGCALPLTSVHAQTRFNSQPGKSTVKVDGESTAHDWEMEGAVIGGYIELGSGVQIDQNKGTISGLQDNKMPATVRANINVKTIHSKAEHLQDVMDHLMQNALKADDFPSIRFEGTTLTLTNSAAGKPFAFNATGQLSIAGVTNAVTFPVSIDQPDADHLHVTGTAKLKMTDFKVDPPAPKLAAGTLKCSDDITIIIDWGLRKRGAQ